MMAFLGRLMDNPELFQAIFPLIDNQVILKSIDAIDSRLRPVGNKFLPILLSWSGGWGSDNPKIRGLVIGDNKELIAMMFNDILQMSLAGLNHPQGGQGFIGG